MSRNLMCLPKCITHNIQMLLRTETSDEQNFCGVWYQCPECRYTVLLPSEKLKRLLNERLIND